MTRSEHKAMCQRLKRLYERSESPRIRRNARDEGCRWAGGERLGTIDPYGRSRSATLYIGRKRGKNRQNQTARCKRLIKRELPIRTVDQIFIDLRCSQVGRENVGATRHTGAGWYQGQPESSLSYEVVFIPSAREKSYRAFTKNIKKLAEKMSNRLCQDSIIIVTDDGDICSAAGASCPRGTC